MTVDPTVAIWRIHLDLVLYQLLCSKPQYGDQHFNCGRHASSSSQLEFICVHNWTGQASAAFLLAEYTALHNLRRHTKITVLLPNLESAAPSRRLRLLLLLLLLLRLLVLLGQRCQSLPLLHVDARVHWGGHLCRIVKRLEKIKVKINAKVVGWGCGNTTVIEGSGFVKSMG